MLLVCAALMFALGISAQTHTITGHVVDEAGEDLIGASVAVKGTSNGSVTDFDGRFTIENAPSKGTLVISYIGFETQEVAINGQDHFEITLSEERSQLNEVVVVGYGSLAKKEISSSVVQIDKKQFNQGVASDPLALVAGKVAGLNVSTAAAANPNSMTDFQVRGAGSLTASNGPLIVIDGIAGGDLREPVQFQDLKELHRLLFDLPLYRIIFGKTQDRRDGRIRHYIVEAGLDIVEDRQVAEKADVLEGPRDTGLVDVHDRFSRCILPVEEDLAPGRFIHLGQKIENGGLSRAVRADQSHDLSVKDLQVQVVDSRKASEVDAQFLYIQYRRLIVLRIGSCSSLFRNILSGPVLISHWKHLLSLCRR